MPISKTCEHNVNPKYCKACKAVKSKPVEGSTLSDQQIENWRAVLYTMFGPYALIMSVSEINKFKGKMQAEINELEE